MYVVVAWYHPQSVMEEAIIRTGAFRGKQEHSSGFRRVPTDYQHHEASTCMYASV